jgi:hypothetical protein
MFDTVVAISVGIGLAAACGFRVFVPTLVIGIAARADLSNHAVVASSFNRVPGTRLNERSANARDNLRHCSHS